MKLLETRGPHTFGAWTVTQIVEWEGATSPYSSLFPGISPGEMRAAVPPGTAGRLTESGMIVISTQFFLLQRKGQVVLVDLGSGNGKTRPKEPYWNNQNLPYLETLAALGVKPENVAYVFISHLHPDHVGLGTTKQAGRWVPAFPGAKYIIGSREWEYWTGLAAGDPMQHACIADSVAPLGEAGCVRLVSDGEPVAGIRAHEAPGHTPGQLLFELEGTPLWFIGDLVHHPAQVNHPDWPLNAPVPEKEMNLIQRSKYFRQFAAAGSVLLAVHLGNPFIIKETGAGLQPAAYP